MANLQIMNIQRCLNLLQEFVDAVQVANSDPDLKELKERAEISLTHLGELLCGKAGEVQGRTIPCSRRARSC